MISICFWVLIHSFYWIVTYPIRSCGFRAPATSAAEPGTPAASGATATPPSVRCVGRSFYGYTFRAWNVWRFVSLFADHYVEFYDFAIADRSNGLKRVKNIKLKQNYHINTELFINCCHVVRNFESEAKTRSNFQFRKANVIDFMKFSKMTMFRASEDNS